MPGLAGHPRLHLIANVDTLLREINPMNGYVARLPRYKVFCGGCLLAVILLAVDLLVVCHQVVDLLVVCHLAVSLLDVDLLVSCLRDGSVDAPPLAWRGAVLVAGRQKGIFWIAVLGSTPRWLICPQRVPGTWHDGRLHGKTAVECTGMDCSKVQCHYNVVNFLKNIHKRHPIARPSGRVGSASDWYPASVPAMMCAISCYIELRYNGTQMYSIKLFSNLASC